MFLSIVLLLGGVICSLGYSPQDGFIKSPNLAERYPSQMPMIWKISLPEGFRISLKFLFFDIKPSERCAQDSVTLLEPYDDHKERIRGRPSQDLVDGKILGRFCGSKNSKSHPGLQIFVSEGNNVTIEFYSDSSTEKNASSGLYYGFIAYYEAVVIAGEDCKKPPNLLNGRYTFQMEPNGNVSISYRCNEPYYKIVTETGSATFTCLKNGVWIDENDGVRIPKCEPVCGKPVNPVTGHGRIIRGDTAEPGNFPWQVLVNKFGRSGGILIGEHWVMTAASTLKMEPDDDLDDLTDLHVFIGDIDVGKMTLKGNLPVEEVHLHPNYIPGLHDHDIALIRLRDPITMDENISPICLPEDGDESLYDTGYVGYISGYGMTERRRVSNLLKYVALPIVRRDSCEKQLEDKQKEGSIRVKKEKFTNNMFCAGYPEANKQQKDSCQGDGGGAYASLGEDKWVATGIVSWGFGCGQGYGYYTKVINYIDWIQGHMNSSSV